MSVIKSATLVAMIVVATALAYGNSTSEPSVEFRQSISGGSTARLSMAVHEDGGAFRSTLHEAPGGPSGSLLIDRGDKRAAEPSREQGQESPLPLPELPTGILTLIGVLAFFPLRRGTRYALVKLTTTE